MIQTAPAPSTAGQTHASHRARLVFFGTAGLAATLLRRLLDHPEAFEVTGVVSQPDRPRGRLLRVEPTEVRQVATERGIPLLQPDRAASPDSKAWLRTLPADVFVVAAYGQILPPSLLEMPPKGCVNIHTSLLPRWRGAAPIQWAIAAGDTHTGVTLMRMDEGMDTGPILDQRRVPILSTDTGQSLHDRLAELGGDLLVESLPAYLDGRLLPRPQPAEGVTLARKLAKADALLDWTRPAPEVDARIRAFHPWPGTLTWIEGRTGPQRLKILQARPLEVGGGESFPPGTVLPSDGLAPRLVVQCGSGQLELLQVQPEGARPMSATQYLAGHPTPRIIPEPDLR